MPGSDAKAAVSLLIMFISQDLGSLKTSWGWLLGRDLELSIKVHGGIWKAIEASRGLKFGSQGIQTGVGEQISGHNFH